MVRTKKYNKHFNFTITHWHKDSNEAFIEAFDDLENDIITLQKNLEIDNQLLEFSYPYGVKSQLDLLTNERSHYRFKTLQTTKLNDKISKKYGISIRSIYNDTFYQETSLNIRSGIEYISFAERSSDQIKPTLLFYGVTQILSGLINLLLDIRSVRHHHGLKLSLNSGDWHFQITKGFFLKIVIFIEIIFNISTIFSFSYWDCPNYENQGIHSVPNKKNTFNLEELNKNKLKINPFKPETDTDFLLFFLNLFYFASYSRYRPSKWAELLKGDQYMYSIYRNTVNETKKWIYMVLQSLFQGVPDMYISYNHRPESLLTKSN